MKLLEIAATILTVAAIAYLSAMGENANLFIYWGIAITSNVLWLFWSNENTRGITIVNATLLIIGFNGLAGLI